MKPAVRYSSDKIAQLRAKLDENPDSVDALNRLAMALYSNGALKEAAGLLRRAVELDCECVEAWVNLGGILLAAWDFKGCIDANLKAACLRPDLVEAHYNQGLGHMYMGNQKEMVSCFERVIELDPQNAGGHYHLAVGLLAVGNAEQARVSLDRAMQLGFHPEPDLLKALGKQETSQTDGEATIQTKHHS